MLSTTPSGAPARRATSNACRLLCALLDEGVLAREAMAAELVLSPELLDRFRDGAVAIPLRRQLCIALLAIQYAPNHARDGQRLRAQVLAAMLYESHATATHLHPPGAYEKTHFARCIPQSDAESSQVPRSLRQLPSHPHRPREERRGGSRSWETSQAERAFDERD